VEVYIEDENLADYFTCFYLQGLGARIAWIVKAQLRIIQWESHQKSE